MNSLMWLLGLVLAEAGTRCRTDTSMDAKTASRRVEHEGDSFLTISLPRFCSDFERCLELGEVDPTLFRGFTKPKKGESLPAFLQGLTGLVFDRRSGSLLGSPDPEAILCIRQVCLMFKKIGLECSAERTRSALDGYVKIDEELRDGIGDCYGDSLQLFNTVGRVIWAEILGGLCFNAGDFHLFMPKHGPGTTAERIRGNAKYVFKSWPERLGEFFPLDMYAFPNASHAGWEDTEDLATPSPGMETPVWVVSVPKTQKTPRIIAVEPVAVQYCQQAISSAMVKALGRHAWTRGRINFSDQTSNQAASLAASVTRDRATLDLSEASDRVASVLVHDMLGSVPLLRDMLFACRSTSALLPGGKTITLRKFASMGSACCFPVESMVFFTAIVAARIASKGLSTTRYQVSRSISTACEGILVYGDDLVVPVDEVLAVIDFLEALGLKVNRRKSFWRGFFRESCGMDAYKGERVTPVYLREVFPADRRSVTSVVSWVSFANQLYKAGWWTVARHVRAKVETVVGPLPYVLETSSALGWHSYLGCYDMVRWDKLLQRPLIRAMVVVPRYKSDPLDGVGALLKCLLGLESNLDRVEDEDRLRCLISGRNPFRDSRHLERSVHSGSAVIKYRWVTPY